MTSVLGLLGHASGQFCETLFGPGKFEHGLVSQYFARNHFTTIQAMSLTHAETLHVVSVTEPDGYQLIYTVNAAGQKHGVEYSYFPGTAPLSGNASPERGTTNYSMISHYVCGEPSGPTLYFNRDGTIGHILHITALVGEKPTLDEVRTYTVMQDDYD
jgi:hypothetical protein